jgi:hypothetical protein
MTINTTAWHAVVALWRRPSKHMLHPYRPELHYMRGPGPACESHQVLAARVTLADRVSGGAN